MSDRKFIVLVTGQRTWGLPAKVWSLTDERRVTHQRGTMLKALHEAARMAFNGGYASVELINGDAKGADRLSTEIGGVMNFDITVFPADWKYGKAAGPQRNARMVDYVRLQREAGNSGICLAFHPDITKSKGTASCRLMALKAKIPTTLLT